MTDLPQNHKIRYFGDYLIIEELASGAMGVVYYAEQVNLKRTVALKVIRAGQLATAMEKRRFRTEAETAANLDHPNIVPIYEIGEQDGREYFSMKLVEGKSLAQAIQDEDFKIPSSSSSVDLKLARERQKNIALLLAILAHAVHHAHQRGVLHRDLKPANVLLDERGEPYLTDFGIAKVFGTDRSQTQTNSVMGTPEFMSPEQARGNAKHVTTASDIFSLGAILYQLLTNQLPFKGKDWAGTLQMVIENEPKTPLKINDNIHPDLQTICLKCLEKAPEHRYQNAAALAEDLEAWIRGEPIKARPISTCERIWKWIRRHPAISGLSTALVLAIAVGMIGIIWQWKQAERERALTLKANIRMAMQRANDQMESQNQHLALATLARTLRNDPNNRAVSERIINVLNQHTFFVPAPWPRNTQPLGDPQVTYRKAHHAGTGKAAWIPDSDISSLILKPGPNPDDLVVLNNAHANVIRSISFSLNGAYLLTASSDSTAQVRDASTGELRITLTNGTPLRCAEFSPQGTHIALADRDGSVSLWDATTGDVISKVRVHQGAANVARFSPDGLQLFTGGEDRIIRVLNVPDLTLTAQSPPLDGAVEDIALATDTPVLMVRLQGGEPRSYTLTNPEEATLETAKPEIPMPTPEPHEVILGLPSSHFHSELVTSIDFSADGQLVATASLDQTARIWKVQTKQPVTDALFHSNVVNGVKFSPDGLRLATSCADGTVRVWDVALGMPLTDPIAIPGMVTGVGFTEDGSHVVSSNGQAWPLYVEINSPPKWLPDLAETIAGRRISDENITLQIAPIEFLDLRKLLFSEDPENLAFNWLRRLLLNH